MKEKVEGKENGTVDEDEEVKRKAKGEERKVKEIRRRKGNKDENKI